MIDDSLRSRLLQPFKIELENYLKPVIKASDISFTDEKTLALDSIKFKSVNVVQNAIGTICGKVCVSIPNKVAQSLANRILSETLGTEVKHEAFNEDVLESLKEFLNIILGNSTKKLENDDLGIIFEPPRIVLNHSEIIDGAKEAVYMQVNSSIGAFDFFYILD